MMKLAMVLVLSVLSVLSVNAVPAPHPLKVSSDSRLSVEHIKTHWENFKLLYSREYEEHEESSRFFTFAKNFVRIMQHNSGKHSYTLGLNKYSDMDISEVRSTMNGFRYTPEKVATGSRYLSPYIMGDLPDSVDWRTKGYVTPVKDQGECGSCWSFSSTGSLEGQHIKATGKLVSLSEQNLMDCSEKYGSASCEGGLMSEAFDYIKNNNGLDTEKSYPYMAVYEGRCKFKKSNVGATVTGYVNLPSGDEQKLKEAVATIGPISVAIDANHDSFQFYKSGIYIEPDCSTTYLDHAVLVVGYGTENGQDYWLVKNSWGESFGADGYIRMARNHNNMCGIASNAIYPLV